MNYSVPSRSRLNQYLLNRGWTREERSDVWVYTEPGDHTQPFRLRVPPSESLDFERLVFLALQTIGAAEGRSADEVAAELSEWASESFGLRFLNERNPSLDEVAFAIPKLRQLMLYSAAAEIGQFDSIVRNVPLEATKFVKDFCEFGHTRKESFGIRVEIPVDPQTQLVEGGASPIGRRLLLRLMGGLHKPEGYFSLNLARVFMELTENLHAAHEYNASFSSFYGTYEGPTRGKVTADIYQSLAIHCDKIVRDHAGAREQVIKGRVKSIAWQDDFRTAADATILWKRRGTHTLSVKMVLDRETALKAFDYARDGLDLAVAGTLIRPVRQHILENPIVVEFGDHDL